MHWEGQQTLLECITTFHQAIKILSERATSSQREPTCPSGKSVVDSNQSIQNELIQTSIKRIQTLLQRFPSLK